MAGSERYYTLSTVDTLESVTSSAEGLTSTEAKTRLGQYGANVLPTAKLKRWYQVLLEQVNSPLVYILLGASAISAFLHEWVDAAVIMAAVLIQVVIGFIQEYKAQSSLQALQQVIALSARVVRSGTEQVVPAQELVPGDIVWMAAGDKVPADVRLLHVEDFAVNEAALTGESDAIVKNVHAIVAADATVGDRYNMSYSGTVVTQGKAKGVVVATGLNTEMGGIARLIKETEDESTPLQQQLAAFAKRLSVVVIVIAVSVFALGYFYVGNALVEMFTVSVALAVSAIPEGLAIAVTIILAAGMQRILKRKGLVRKLVAAETLGSTDVICTDKTGTLTEGNMQVAEIITWDETNSNDRQQALSIGVLCNDAKVNNPDDMVDEWVLTGNLTERALLLAAMQDGMHFQDAQKAAPRIDTVPFDSAIKYMATLHRAVQGRMLYVKGAPEIVLAQSTHLLEHGKAVRFDEENHKQFQRKFIRLSEKGLRIIGLAYKHCGSAKTVEEAGVNDLVFVGYVGIKDPLRPQAKQTVAQCQQAGITTVMITGDHKLTAKAIAQELGIDVSQPQAIMEGSELDTLTQYELNERVQQVRVYARVTPQHKLRIVQAWQSHQMVVAMTGDGINDAPAIKAADIGVALGSGTDVAKETADMVILDDDFSTIVAAVEEGRGIFDNIRKTVLYLISDSFTEVLLVVAAVILGVPVPVTAAMILWINIISDSFPSLAMTQEPKEPDAMLEKPRGRHSKILDTEVKVLTAIISVITGAVNLGLFVWLYKRTGDVDYARTMIFLSIGIDSLFFMFSIRSLRKLLHQTHLFSNPWLVLSLFVGIAAQALPIYVPVMQTYFGTVPLAFDDWALIFAVVVVEMAIIEFCKYIFLRLAKRQVA